MSTEKFEAVIGIEVHVQLKTKSKMFCGCSTEFAANDNENTCPVCTGMPGALPVTNKRAIEFAVRTGLALNCDIRERSVFSRKNYFYPDLPKGYQISQYDKPICEKGYVDILIAGQKKRIGITRAHLEEDAGKSNHSASQSLINLNRSSVPLLEIVSEPEIRSAEEAAEYVRSIRSIVQYLDVCDGNLEEGSMRADCNVSIRPRGQKEFGTKVELKNINSFRFIEKALEYEIARQIDLVEAGEGESIVQETRLYDSDKNRTYSMRSKEEAHDYRYFPEPDLLICLAPNELIREVQKNLPELPIARAERFQKEYALPEYDSFVLTQSKKMADYFEALAEQCKNPKLASNWIMTELMRVLKEEKLEIEESKISSKDLGDLLLMIESKEISGKIAKQVFEDMWSTQKGPKEIVAAKGLVQISDDASILAMIDDIFAKNPGQLSEYRSGKDKLFGFFVGQVMKASKGQANPDLVNRLLKEKL